MEAAGKMGQVSTGVSRRWIRMTPSAIPTQERRPMSVGFRRALTVAGLVAAVTAGGMLLILSSERAVTPFWISALYPLFYFTVAWRCYVTARTSSAYDRSAWFLFAMALASYGCGEVVWGVYESGFGINVTTLSVADIGYVASSLLLVAGVWIYTQAAGTRAFTLARVGDLGIVIAAVVLANTFVYQGQLHLADSIFMAIVQQLAAIAFATAFCIALIALALRAAGRRRIVLILIALALVIKVGPNFTTYFTLVERTFSGTDPFNVVYLVFAALFYWAAFEQTYLPADNLTENESTDTDDRALQWESLFPAIAVTLILSWALVFRDVLNASTLPYIMVGAIIFTVSLAVRSWWGQSTETALRNLAVSSQDRLEQVNRELREEMETRTQVEDELRHVQKMDAVGQLTGGIAHDFNNLLAVILGNLELLQQYVEPQAEHRKFLDHATDAAERGASLTQRLLALSRKQALNPVAVDTDRLLSNLEVLLKLTLGGKYDVDVVMNPTAWGCEADLAQLENAILNLALNARDAMPKGGKLRLEASNVELDETDVALQPDVVAGSYVAIMVRDSGVGISPANLPKVFDPFFTTKDVGKGTGLGLSMVYGFARQSGGHVRIESERGVGTSVMLYLPRSKRLPGAEAVRAEENMPRGNGESILIVEDETAVRKMVTLMLTNLGYQVSSAENATEALSLLETPDSLDLLLTDVVLPGGISGRELVRRVERQRPELKVLLMSGYATERLLEDGDLTESTMLLHKPFSSAQLASMVHDSLAGSSTRQGTSKSGAHLGAPTSA